MIYELEYDVLPPSANAGNRRGRHWASAREIKKQWEGIFMVLLLKAKVPKGLARVHVNVELQFKGNKRGDPDNYYAPISKPLADCLVKCDWIPDDGPDHYSMDIRAKKGMPATKMVLTLTTEVAPPPPAPGP